MMRFLPLAALAVFSLAVPAWAQDLGHEVQVYPISASGRGMLLYPGGQFMRLVPALRQPGDRGGPIRLHMPAKRAPRTAIARAEVPREAPRPAPAPKLASAAPSRPAPNAAPPAAGSPFASGPGAAGLFNSLPTLSAAPSASAPPGGAPPSGTEGLAMQGQILFAHDADTPSEDSLDSIRVLAGRLNGSLSKAQARVELMAYGGAKGDKGSDARRLSLKRSLAIRQLLIDSGVSSARIDVHAQGGVDDTGPTDRVDVYIRG